jgi:D-cysteine desulfhydrase
MIDVLQKTPLARLPTPVSSVTVRANSKTRDIWVKHDDVSGEPYGGNKVRKLEYIFHRAALRKATRVATFGAVASNHALATALYARKMGLNCTCFLSHQAKSEKTASALQVHLGLGTELVHLAGDYRSRIETLRRHVQGRNCWVIPVGGSSWLGSVGFVNAAFELAEQIREGTLPCPDELYVATGTMGTAAGLTLGLALAGLPTRVQAIRVTEERFANRADMRRLIEKIALMMRLHGADIDPNIMRAIKLDFRDDFFAGGYTKVDDVTENAVNTATETGLKLETTYTGKAMAALLDDVERARHAEKNLLFWNTCNSRPLVRRDNEQIDLQELPVEFRRYFD